MPGNPRAIVAEAEQRFPVRIAVRVPGSGIGQHYKPMMDWLDENCGIDGWRFTPTGRRYGEHALAVYVSTPTCAVAFVARWLVPGNSPGLYELRQDEPAKRVPLPAHGGPSG